MAKFAALLLLLSLSIATTKAAVAPVDSPKPSQSFVLTPYAAVPPSDSPPADIFDDGDAAPIGAPASNYPPAEGDVEPAKNSALIAGVNFPAAVASAAAGAIGYFLL